MEVIRRFFAGEDQPPPDQASTAPLDPRRVTGERPDGARRHITSGAAQVKANGHVMNNDALLLLTGSSDGNDDLPDFGLFCIADGVGDDSDGLKASSVAVRSIGRNMAQGPILDFLEPEPLAHTRSLQEMMRLAIQQANREVRARAEGSTAAITSALVFDEQMILGHVGDTRAYIIDEEGIRQITRDHSLVQELVETGTITPEEALVHPQRDVLWNAMGKAIDVKVDIHVEAIPRDGFLLLCSDGLWGALNEEEILQSAHGSPGPHAYCEVLVEQAKRSGAEDDVSVVAVYFPAN
ncbi:MAG: protein phosphatase 2C domain-containing protein [Anaerolineales bacterium]|jgi:serine/threonine protein phosphatase PrpC